MAVDVVINSIPFWNASNLSVTEDATPTDPSDSSGGVGQFTIGIPDQGPAPKLRGRIATVSDGAQGTTVGVVRGLDSDGSTLTVTVDSRMTALNVTRTAQPYTGTLGGAFTYYLSLVGLTTGIIIDSSISGTAVTFTGWSGNVWDKLRQMASVYGVEISLVSNNIVLRAIRTRVAQNYRDSGEGWTIDATSIARAVEVYYTQAAQRTNALAYPLGGWNSGVQAFTVNAGETVTQTISLLPNGIGAGASLSSIQQPTCVDSVTQTYSASSVYCIAGNDGLPIPAAQWLAGGGSITVAINPDTTSLTVTIVGSVDTKYAPYRIGMSSGTSNFYSSLRLVGTGVFTNKQMVRFDTGNTVDQAPQDVGATIDCEFVNSYLDAVSVGRAAVARWAGPSYTINVTTTGINRVGDTGAYTYQTMGEFNVDPDFAGKTMAQFNTAFAGMTMKQFNDYETAKVANRFENQAFGNVAGARVLLNNCYFRISTATLSQDSVSYTATRDTTMADFNTAAAGMTMGQFNALHAGETMGDFSLAPLRVS